MKYLTPEQVYKQFGYHPKTTAEWADLERIKSGFFTPVSAQKPSC
ncbi:MAG: hypothetical protein NTY89_01800 [Nostocales cyanobacterium LacPavin_0920_SED1_MAG_38_18]|nr:hypothetical protein [Nostocales cyanobacterium LacPavin_0920_SED1_MAG_38_18]